MSESKNENKPFEALESSAYTPRLPSSQKWTALPPDFISNVRKIFADQFDIESENGTFLIDGRIYPDEIIVRAGYLESGRLKQTNFEASMDLVPVTAQAAQAVIDEEAPSQTLNRLYVCIDALGGLMEEFFNLGEDEEMDVPLRWKAYKFDGEEVFLQHSTVNSTLEEEADRILGLTGSKVFDEAFSEDALTKAEVDSELAFGVQQYIREGKYPRAHTYESEPNEEDLNSEKSN